MSNVVTSSSTPPTIGGHIDTSILNLFLHADIVVQTVLLSLIAASVICWAIIFDKAISLKKTLRSTDHFEQNFWSGQLLDNLYKNLKDKDNHPMAAIFVAAMHEWNRRHHNAASAANNTLQAGVKERLFQAMSVAQNRSMERMEKNMTFLATVASAAPFIGLFGTVWGIMNSFQSIGQEKSASLVVVAPGISEALLATAVGLFAAIPSVIFYNLFSNKLDNYSMRLEDFANELSALLSRKIDEIR